MQEVDREFGMAARRRALALWREVSGASLCETEPRFSHVDAIAWPKPPIKPYFIEVQSRRCAIQDYPSLMFDKGQYEHILNYHRDLGFPTLLLAVWRDGLGYLLLPDSLADPVLGEEVHGGQAKVMLDIQRFSWVGSDVFAKYFPSEFFS